jgi:hypothetical protein
MNNPDTHQSAMRKSSAGLRSSVVPESIPEEDIRSSPPPVPPHNASHKRAVSFLSDEDCGQGTSTDDCAEMRRRSWYWGNASRDEVRSLFHHCIAHS